MGVVIEICVTTQKGRNLFSVTDIRLTLLLSGGTATAIGTFPALMHTATSPTLLLLSRLLLFRFVTLRLGLIARCNVRLCRRGARDWLFGVRHSCRWHAAGSTGDNCVYLPSLRSTHGAGAVRGHRNGSFWWVAGRRGIDIRGGTRGDGGWSGGPCAGCERVLLPGIMRSVL
jgi:hypothetical protein